MAESMKHIEKAVKKSKSDFANGTIVTWTASDRYTYAAIKTPIGWYTTAREYNRFVDQVITFAGMLEIIARGETSNVRVVGLEDGTKVDGSGNGETRNDETGFTSKDELGNLSVTQVITVLKDYGIRRNVIEAALDKVHM